MNSEQVEKQLRQNADALLLPTGKDIPLASVAGALQMAADEIFKLRKIAAFVPAGIYIEAKERAGFPTYVKSV